MPLHCWHCCSRAGGRGLSCGRLEEDPTRLVSAATLLETAIVIEARKGEPGGRELDALIQKAEVVAVDAERTGASARDGTPRV
jgi:uncharacterized protein with PIN domain